ncbi:hypothetical protein PR048_029679 [Dryococelus australis]|uniref:DNA-directed DNA polymerase n=1 Tax=Dryococelus australis TaxID=614101 RepID=A0ABQ9GFZ3_9NEOP|nr:hypothetical protein PR048_029679 [Dryococelus australis]
MIANSRDWVRLLRLRKLLETHLMLKQVTQLPSTNMFHTLVTFCWFVHTILLSLYFEFVGADCILKLVDKLVELTKWVAGIYSVIVLIKPKTPADEARLAAQKSCHICKELFGTDDVVVNHDHLMGKIRGCAHNKCKLNFRLPKRQVVAVFHNLQNYDAHFLIKPLAEHHVMLHDGTVLIKIPEKIQVIGMTFEKYKRITKQIPNGTDCNGNAQYFKLRFIDPFQFMSASLETLAGNLLLAQLSIAHSMFPDNTQFELAKRKGLPDSMCKSLPPKDGFHNMMRGEDISDEYCAHAQTTWDAFNCINLLQYAILYLRVYTCLLVDVFENFRTVCLAHYGLDPTI